MVSAALVSLMPSSVGGVAPSQPMPPRSNADDPATKHVHVAPGSAVKPLPNHGTMTIISPTTTEPQW